MQPDKYNRMRPNFNLPPALSMQRIVFLVAACAHLALGGAVNSGRVVGGSEVVPGAVPWQVFVEGVASGSAVTSCGAVLISDTHVLTAAQCLQEGTQIARVYLGAHDVSATEEENRVVMETGDFTVHPDYSTAFYENDIAVITLPRAVTASEFIAAATLPAGADIESDLIGAEGVFAGWGSATGDINDWSSVLQSTKVSVTQQVDCNGHYGDDWMSANKLCVSTAALTGPCFGDAGSPIVREADKVVMGIFSFLDIKSCDGGFAVGFTRVGAYVDWINGIVAKHN